LQQSLQLRRRIPARFEKFTVRENIQVFYAFLIVKVPCIQGVLAIGSAMASILQQPYFSSAFRRVELCHRAVNFEEDTLRDVLSLAAIPNNFERDTEYETLVSLKKHHKSIVNAICNLTINWSSFNSFNSATLGGAAPDLE
jgi:hypothetical protein